MKITDFKDYRAFVRALLKAQGKKIRGSHRQLAEFLRVEPSYLSQMLSGTRPLSSEHGLQIANYFGLSFSERDLFLFMLECENAGTADLKEYWKNKIQEQKFELKKLSKQISYDAVLSEKDKVKFYSSYIYSAVRLFTSLGEGKTLEEIMLYFELERAKALKILDFLTAAGLCLSEAGTYKMGPQRTHLESSSDMIPRMHTNWRLRSILRSDDISPEELMFSAPVSIDQNSFAEIRNDLLELIKKSSDRVKKCSPEDLAIFNIDLLWFR